MTTGYSKTPLTKKLGIKPGYRCFFYRAFDGFYDLLEDLPGDLEVEEDSPSEAYDYLHAFLRYQKDLEKTFAYLKPHLKKNGSFWVSWPKGSSKLEKDISDRDVRETGLKAGLVDVKVCAIDQDWSGLKFMYRLKDR